MFDSRTASKKEKFFYHNTLVSLVKALENRYTVIDLRNESCVTGKIESVDGYMNIDMINAIYYDSRGEEYPFEKFFVRNRNIRYVHMPKGSTCKELLEQQVNSLSNVSMKPKTLKGTFKHQRARKYNEQIMLSNIASTSKD